MAAWALATDAAFASFVSCDAATADVTLLMSVVSSKSARMSSQSSDIVSQPREVYAAGLSQGGWDRFLRQGLIFSIVFFSLTRRFGADSGSFSRVADFSGVGVAPTCPRLLAMGIHTRKAKKQRTTRGVQTFEKTNDDATNKRYAASTFFSGTSGVLSDRMTATTLTRTMRSGPEQRMLAGIQYIASCVRQGLQIAVHGGVRVLAGLFSGPAVFGPALAPPTPLSGIGFLPGIIDTIRDLFLEVSATDGACGLLKMLKDPLRKMLERAEMPNASSAAIFRRPIQPRRGAPDDPLGGNNIHFPLQLRLRMPCQDRFRSCVLMVTRPSFSGTRLLSRRTGLRPGLAAETV